MSIPFFSRFLATNIRYERARAFADFLTFLRGNGTASPEMCRFSVSSVTRSKPEGREQCEENS
jgi:hypothetical protein